MGDPSLGTPPPVKPLDDRLDSWKEIAAYLHRDVTTVQRWEKREGMPVHRHQHDRVGSVYAFSSELDAWQQRRRLQLEDVGVEAKAGTPAEAISDDPAKQRARMRYWFTSGGMIVLALVGLVLSIRTRWGAAAQPKVTSLAVLPLKNLSGDATQEYLADGMTESIIGRLSMIRGLRVISRTSVMQLKNTQLSAPEIAKTLGVDALVEGSVIRQGGRVRVHAQLIRAATDEHFWSETYDRDLGDALALESDVAQSIAERVQVTITGEERNRLVATRPVAPEVYESYLKGAFGKGNSRAEIAESVGYFEEAIRKDPTFAPAYLGLAFAYDNLGTVLVGAPPGEVRPKAIGAARKALELDPNLADAHVLLGDIHQARWQWAEAENEYKTALQLNPNDSAALKALSSWLTCQGRTDEALDSYRRARELDPVGTIGTGAGWILFHARRYEEAIRELRSSVAVQPDNATAHWFLGFVLIANGQPNAAIPELEKTLALTTRSPAVMGVLVRAYAHAGRRADALHLLEEMKRRQKIGYVPAAAFVNAYLGLDDREQAFAWLERAYQEQSNILKWIKVHPFFDPLRSDPRFADLLRRVGLDQAR